MKFFTLFLFFFYFTYIFCSKLASKDKLIETLKNNIKEKSDYIKLLEQYIKENVMKNGNKMPSFLEIKEKSSSEMKSKAGPVLKAMLFGFPNPRQYLFGSQTGKNGEENQSKYQNLKICEPGCMVMG